MGASGLGALLVKEGFLTEQDRATITKTCGQSSWAFAKSILAVGLLDEDELAAFFAERTRYVIASKDFINYLDQKFLQTFDKRILTRLEVLPLKQDATRITVAVVDPLDRSTIKQLEFFTGLEINPIIAPLSQIYEGLRRLDSSYEPRFTALTHFLNNHASAAWMQQRILNGEAQEIFQPPSRAYSQRPPQSHDEDEIEEVSDEEEFNFEDRGNRSGARMQEDDSDPFSESNSDDFDEEPQASADEDDGTLDSFFGANEGAREAAEQPAENTDDDFNFDGDQQAQAPNENANAPADGIDSMFDGDGDNEEETKARTPSSALGDDDDSFDFQPSAESALKPSLETQSGSQDDLEDDAFDQPEIGEDLFAENLSVSKSKTIASRDSSKGDALDDFGFDAEPPLETKALPLAATAMEEDFDAMDSERDTGEDGPFSEEAKRRLSPSSAHTPGNEPAAEDDEDAVFDALNDDEPSFEARPKAELIKAPAQPDGNASSFDNIAVDGNVDSATLTDDFSLADARSGDALLDDIKGKDLEFGDDDLLSSFTVEEETQINIHARPKPMIDDDIVLHPKAKTPSKLQNSRPAQPAPSPQAPAASSDQKPEKKAKSVAISPAPAASDDRDSGINSTALVNELMLRVSLCFDSESFENLLAETLPQLAKCGSLIRTGISNSCLSAWRDGKTIELSAAEKDKILQSSEAGEWCEFTSKSAQAEAIQYLVYTSAGGSWIWCHGNDQQSSFKEAIESLVNQLEGR